MRSNKPIFLKSVISLLFVIGLGCLILLRAVKKRSSFLQVTGVVAAYGNSNRYFVSRDTAKFRYLEIDKFPKTFELFIGKSSGDFNPAFENVDDLKSGDSITIFYDENYQTQNNPVNRLAYFIDRGKQAIFIKGNSEKILAYVLIGGCVVFIAVLVLLKRRGKIS